MIKKTFLRRVFAFPTLSSSPAEVRYKKPIYNMIKNNKNQNIHERNVTAEAINPVALSWISAVCTI
jgi:hypothetical protein